MAITKDMHAPNEEIRARSGMAKKVPVAQSPEKIRKQSVANCASGKMAMNMNIDLRSNSLSICFLLCRLSRNLCMKTF